jgi:hypothetical protein
MSKHNVAPIKKAVYCEHISEYVPADACSKCKYQHGYGFVKDAYDMFGVICEMSKSGLEPTVTPSAHR